VGVFYVLAAICFLVAVVAAYAPRLSFVPWVPLGLFFWVLPTALEALNLHRG
jgi:hypothetical protein